MMGNGLDPCAPLKLLAPNSTRQEFVQKLDGQTLYV